MRKALLASAAGTVLAGPVVLAFFSGGFFEGPRVTAAIVVWIVAAVAFAVSPSPVPRSSHGRAALAGLALLTAWAALSYEWAPLGGRAQDDVQRLLLYLGFFASLVALLRESLMRRLVEPALALGALTVTAYALSARLLPGLVELDRSSSADGRLEQPLTYWNAMGCLASIGLLLCVRIAADGRRPRGLRAAAAFGAPALGLGVYLSFSRGALFALGAGLALLVALAPSPRAQLRSVAGLVGAGAIAAVVASRLPQVQSLPQGQSGDSGDGLLALAVLLLLGAGCALWVARAPEPGAQPPVVRARRRVVAATLSLFVLAGVAAAAVIEQSPSARPGGNPTNPTRFTSADSTRYEFWEAALEAFAEDPLKGTGSGGFAVEWRRRPDRVERAVDAHSLYVETLSELGLPGAGFLLLFFGGVATCAARLHRRDPALAAGPTAALLVWAVHAGLDWDWEMPALTGFALVLAGGLVAWQDETAPASSG